MSKERLGSAVVAVVVGLVVGFVLIPESPQPPDGTYVLVEGTIDGVDLEPGLDLTIDGDDVSGSTPCNTFGGGFMTLAGCLPALEWDEFHLVETVDTNPKIVNARLIYESEWGRLVYEPR